MRSNLLFSIIESGINDFLAEADHSEIGGNPKIGSIAILK